MGLSPLSALQICNNFNHLIVCAYDAGFAICWNGDHERHPGMPILSYHSTQGSTKEDVVSVLKDVLLDIRAFYQNEIYKKHSRFIAHCFARAYYQRAGLNWLSFVGSERLSAFVECLLGGLVEADCPLTLEMINMIIDEVQRESSVDTGVLFAKAA